MVIDEKGNIEMKRAQLPRYRSEDELDKIRSRKPGYFDGLDYDEMRDFFRQYGINVHNNFSVPWETKSKNMADFYKRHGYVVRHDDGKYIVCTKECLEKENYENNA